MLNWQTSHLSTKVRKDRSGVTLSFLIKLKVIGGAVGILPISDHLTLWWEYYFEEGNVMSLSETLFQLLRIFKRSLVGIIRVIKTVEILGDAISTAALVSSQKQAPRPIRP